MVGVLQIHTECFGVHRKLKVQQIEAVLAEMEKQLKRTIMRHNKQECLMEDKINVGLIPHKVYL